MSSTLPTAVFRTDHVTGGWSALSPTRWAVDLFGRRQFLWRFAMREIQGRYRGSYLGIAWALVTPLLMLLVYTTVFHSIMHLSWDNGPDNFINYAAPVFSGIVAFGVFSESVTRASGLIVQNPNYVKKVVFPLQILPASLVVAAVVHSLLSLAVLIVLVAWGNLAVHASLIFLPLVYVPLILLTLGCSWLLAALGVFLRDIGNLVSVAIQLLFFLTPIMYSDHKVTGLARRAMWLNPLAIIVINFRRVINEGVAPDWISLSLVTVFAFVVVVLGYAFFQTIKRAFADVI